MPMINDEMKSCIADAVIKRACRRRGHCLEIGGQHTEPKHFTLMMACAEICRTSAHFMLLGSDLHKLTCRECAEICEQCAVERVGEMLAVAVPWFRKFVGRSLGYVTVPKAMVSKFELFKLAHSDFALVVVMLVLVATVAIPVMVPVVMLMMPTIMIPMSMPALDHALRRGRCPRLDPPVPGPVRQSPA